MNYREIKRQFVAGPLLVAVVLVASPFIAIPILSLIPVGAEYDVFFGTTMFLIACSVTIFMRYANKWLLRERPPSLTFEEQERKVHELK